jgi:hypothetical protein
MQNILVAKYSAVLSHQSRWAVSKRAAELAVAPRHPPPQQDLGNPPLVLAQGQAVHQIPIAVRTPAEIAQLHHAVTARFTAGRSSFQNVAMPV